MTVAAAAEFPGYAGGEDPFTGRDGPDLPDQVDRFRAETAAGIVAAPRIVEEIAMPLVPRQHLALGELQCPVAASPRSPSGSDSAIAVIARS